MYKIIDSEFVTFESNVNWIRVVILCDTSADIPEPESSWDVGSMCWQESGHNERRVFKIFAL